jgi:hypothetical protein
MCVFPLLLGIHGVDQIEGGPTTLGRFLQRRKIKNVSLH